MQTTEDAVSSQILIIQIFVSSDYFGLGTEKVCKHDTCRYYCCMDRKIDASQKLHLTHFTRYTVLFYFVTVLFYQNLLFYLQFTHKYEGSYCPKH